MSEATTVAVLGMGRMGAAMAGTLRRAGFGVVVYNRTGSTAAEVAGAVGAEVAETAAGAAASADIVISCLSDDAAVKAVLTGPDGAASGLRPGAVVVDMSTIDPKTLEELQPAIAAAGATLLDAPVSGSVSLAETGALTAMVGGDAGALERARPALDALAATVFHVGPLGSGATMKLAVNAVVHAINVAMSEALVLAEKAGVKRTAAYEVIASSAAGAPFVTYKRAAFENPEETPVAFNLDLVAKDLDLILELAGRVDVDMVQATANRQVAGNAVAAGLGAADMSAIAGYLRNDGEPKGPGPRGAES